MDQIYRLKDSVLGFLSPSKRRHTVLPSTPSAPMQRPLQPMSEPKGKDKAVITGRVSKKYLSPNDTKRYTGHRGHKLRRPAIESSQASDEELEVDTEPSDINPDDSISQIEDVTAITDHTEEYEESKDEFKFELDDESEISTEAKVEKFLDHQTEYEQRMKTLDEIKKGDWTEEEIALFQKLSMRGFEPLMPTLWHHDFRTCPANIFTDNDYETFLNAKSNSPSSQFRAIAALQSLISLGGRVRDLLRVRKPQEPLIKKEIQNYIKWSEKDGGYHNLRFLPVLCLVAGHPDQEIAQISKSVTDQLDFLAKRHRQYLALPPPGRVNGETGEVEMFRRKPPVLYGVIIAHYITVFVTLDSSNPDAKVKTIAHFDFNDSDMDVWNGFAVAILVVTARDYIMSHMHELEVDDQEASDPDA